MKFINNDLLKEMQGQLRAVNLPMSIEANNIEGNNSSSNFGDILSDAVAQISLLQDKSSDLSTRLDMGDSTVTLSDTVIAREKASVALSAAMEVRNKFVEAYQAVLNMPV